jgi:hypothetical protein
LDKMCLTDLESNNVFVHFRSLLCRNNGTFVTTSEDIKCCPDPRVVYSDLDWKCSGNECVASGCPEGESEQYTIACDAQVRVAKCQI